MDYKKTGKKKMYKKKPKVSSSKKLKTLERKVNTLTREVQGEVKLLQQSSVANCAALNAGGNGCLLDGPLALSSQGTGSVNRIGNKVKLLSMQVKGFIVQQSETRSDRLIRCMLVENRDHNLLSPTITVTNITGNLYDADPRTSTITTQSFRNFVNKNNWRILASKNVFIPGDNITGQSLEKTFSMYVRFKKGITQNYNSVASALEKGAIYFICVADSGDSNPASLTGVRINYDIRTLFVDN